MTDPRERRMRRAVEVARGNPEAPFGCVIADAETGEVLAEGLNNAEESPILHGETAAIINLFEECPDVDPSRLVLYTTAEPCPMCSGAILWSGIPAVAYGTSIATLKCLGLPLVGIPCEEVSRRASWEGFEAAGGVLESECDALFEGLTARGEPAVKRCRSPSARWPRGRTGRPAWTTSARRCGPGSCSTRRWRTVTGVGSSPTSPAFRS